MECWRRKKQKENEKEKEKEKEKEEARKYFLKNGSVFLKELIADCNGISNPIRMFSSDQISKATNHFDPNCSHPEVPSRYSYLGFTFYKGVIEGRSYVIKSFSKFWDEDNPYNDIVLSARVSNHISFLKLMGCCLEFPQPVMVFENLEYRSLNHRGSVGCWNGPMLPWNVRLKIAKDVATAITYLHTAFSRIIIHRDISAINVFLDKNGTAKLTDLKFAVTLPEGKSWIKDKVRGNYEYTDPIYRSTGILTEYSDVYSFGILMLVFLLGKRAVFALSSGVHCHILDYVKDMRERGEPVEFGGDSNDMRPGQMKMFLDLALRCCEERNEDRPKMIFVAKQIKLIERSLDC